MFRDDRGFTLHFSDYFLFVEIIKDIERDSSTRDSNSLLLLLALWNGGRAYLRVYPSVFYANFNSLYIARGLYCIDIAIYGMRDSFVKFETRWEDVHVVNCITSICISRRIVGKK